MKLAYQAISDQQNALWFNTPWKDSIDFLGYDFFPNSIDQHRLIADWAAERRPPFGKAQKVLNPKYHRKENRYREMFFIGETEIDVLKTLKEL